jgi:hypothetical protein
MKIQYVEYVQSVILYISSPISLALSPPPPPPPPPNRVGSEPLALYNMHLLFLSIEVLIFFLFREAFISFNYNCFKIKIYIQHCSLLILLQAP